MMHPGLIIAATSRAIGGGAAAPSQTWTPGALNTITEGPDYTFTRTSGGPDWNAAGSSDETTADPFTIEAYFSDPTGYFHIGVLRDGFSRTPVFGFCDFQFIGLAGGQLKVAGSGGTSELVVGTFTGATKLEIVRVALALSFKVDGVEVDTGTLLGSDPVRLGFLVGNAGHNVRVARFI